MAKKTSIEFAEVEGHDVATVERAKATQGAELGALATPIASETPTVPTPRHALDDAPVNSKVINTGKQAWIATPDDPTQPEDTIEAMYDRGFAPRNPTKLLPPGDLAHKLPNGAKITKTGPESYVAVQLDHTIGVAPLTTTTAMDAILQFVPHFHGGEPVR